MKQMGQDRKPYYWNMGTNVVGCDSVDEVLTLSGLDFEVEKQPIFLGNNTEIKGKYATVRKDTGKVLGIVGDGYEVVQNREGFDFIDACLGEGITFRKAGMYNKGERIFMVGEAPTVDICGDEVHPSILFTNSHDGSGSIKAMFTPMRIVCENGLMIPIAGHEKGVVNIRISHTKSAHDRIMIAEQLITENNAYIQALRNEAEGLLNTKMDAAEFALMSRELAEVKPNQEKLTRGQEALITDLADAYEEEDIQKFDNTAWKAMMAVSDVDTHKESMRGNNPEYSFERVAYGMTLLVAAYQYIVQRFGRAWRR